MSFLKFGWKCLAFDYFAVKIPKTGKGIKLGQSRVQDSDCGQEREREREALRKRKELRACLISLQLPEIDALGSVPGIFA